MRTSQVPLWTDLPVGNLTRDEVLDNITLVDWLVALVGDVVHSWLISWSRGQLII